MVLHDLPTGEVPAIDGDGPSRHLVIARTGLAGRAEFLLLHRDDAAPTEGWSVLTVACRPGEDAVDAATRTTVEVLGAVLAPQPFGDDVLVADAPAEAVVRRPAGFDRHVWLRGADAAALLPVALAAVVRTLTCHRR